MMKTALLILFLALPVFAEDFYVAEVLQGNGGGSSEANATNKLFFNTSGNWGVGAGKISAGDTVIFVGTHTTNAVIQGSGSAGSPITIRFAAGAKFSKGTWNQSGSNGDAALYGTGRSYIDVDGGGNQDVDFECTSNGTGLTTSNHAVGIQFDNSAFINVFGVRATNMYLRTTGSEDNAVGGCIQFRSGAYSVMVSNCIVSDANVPIYVAYSAGNSNVTIRHCWGTKAGEGVIVMGALSGAASLTNTLIYNNRFFENLAWSGQPNIHVNCIHLHSFISGSRMTGTRIYNNEFGGNMGSAPTSYLFIEGEMEDSFIYNNLFRLYDAETAGGNGMLFVKGTRRTYVFNNTFWSESPRYNAMALGGSYGGTGWDTNIFATNNLSYNVALPITSPYNPPAISGSDYNVFYASGGTYPLFTYTNTAQRVFSNGSTGWKDVTPFDDNSTTSQPTLDANLVPTSADTIARAGGVNLTAWGIATDYYGNPRPSSGSWSIGAFQYQELTPIDNQATGAGVAGLRNLRFGVIHTNAFTEAMEYWGYASAAYGLTNQPILWMKASGHRFRASDGDAVTEAQDYSSRGLHLGQATAGKRPTYKTGSIGGLPTFRFDGGDCLTNPAIASTTHTLFVVLSNSSHGIVLEQSADASANSGCYIYTDTTCGQLVNRSSTISSKNGTTDWGINNRLLARFTHDGNHTGNTGRTNGTLFGSVTCSDSGNPGTGSATGAVNIGARNNAASAALTGHISEILWYSPKLSDGDAAIVEAALNAKYGGLY